MAAARSRSIFIIERPELFSSTNSRANAPLWISSRISFIVCRTRSSTMRGPRVRSPYSAVSEIE